MAALSSVLAVNWTKGVFYSWFFLVISDNEKVAELLQAIKEKSVTLDTIRHAPHPLCASPPAQSSGE